MSRHSPKPGFCGVADSMKKYVFTYIKVFVIASVFSAIVFGIFAGVLWHLFRLNLEGLQVVIYWGVVVVATMVSANSFSDDFNALPTGEQKTGFVSGVVLFDVGMSVALFVFWYFLPNDGYGTALGLDFVEWQVFLIRAFFLCPVTWFCFGYFVKADVKDGLNGIRQSTASAQTQNPEDR